MRPEREAAARQVVRDAVVVLIQDCSDVEVAALSNADVLGLLSTMRDELTVVAHAYASDMEGGR